MIRITPWPAPRKIRRPPLAPDTCRKLEEHLREKEAEQDVKDRIMLLLADGIINCAPDEFEKIRRTLLKRQVETAVALRHVVGTYALGCGDDHAEELPDVLRKLDGILETLKTIPVKD